MIYYVEDDDNIRDLVVFTLNAQGFGAKGFERGETFREAVAAEKPELILLDIMLPGEDGIELLKQLKTDERTMALPVIMVSAKGTEHDRVLGLEVGADDYITKPFSMMELLARVKAVLRRCRPEGVQCLNVEGISLNPVRHLVLVNGREVVLTFKEFELLRYLMEHVGEAFDRDKLLSAVWSTDYFGGTRTVDVHIQTLRKKLGPEGEQIETIYGYGYRLRRNR